MYKLAISNIAWDESQADDIYKVLAQHHIDLEIAPPKVIAHFPHYENADVMKFKHHIANQNIQIVSMQSILFGVTAELFRSQQEYDVVFKHVQQVIQCAELLSCKNIVFGSPKNRNIFCDDDKQKGIDFFRALGERALQHHTVIAIEANPQIYGTNYINTTEEAFELVKEVKCDGLKVNVDLGTIIENNESLEVLVRNKEYINHIHISEPYLEKIEHREIHNELAQVLKTIGYDQYLSIEMKQQSKDDILKSIQYVKEVFYGI